MSSKTLVELYPNKGESKEDFIKRFMSDKDMNQEYPTKEQRYAVALSYWKKKNEDLNNPNIIDDIDKFLQDIYDLRKESLDKDGEYGMGNLIFKSLRSKGYLDNLKNLKKKLTSKELSLD